EGPWYLIGPFDNEDNRGFDTAYPPEKEIDLAKKYPGRDGPDVGWTRFKEFRVGQVVNLARFGRNDNTTVYLFHEIDAPGEMELPVSLGSDDTLSVWLNGKRLVHENAFRAAAPDQNRATLKLKPGKNQLLVKVGNLGGGFAVYVAPEFPVSVSETVRK